MHWKHEDRPDLIKTAGRLVAARSQVYVSQPLDISEAVVLFEEFLESLPIDIRGLATASLEANTREAIARSASCDNSRDRLAMMAPDAIISNAQAVLEKLNILVPRPSSPRPSIKI